MANYEGGEGLSNDDTRAMLTTTIDLEIFEKVVKSKKWRVAIIKEDGSYRKKKIKHRN